MAAAGAWAAAGAEGEGEPAPRGPCPPPPSPRGPSCSRRRPHAPPGRCSGCWRKGGQGSRERRLRRRIGAPRRRVGGLGSDQAPVDGVRGANKGPDGVPAEEQLAHEDAPDAPRRADYEDLRRQKGRRGARREGRRLVIGAAWWLWTE